jgi:hypothetical protein
LEGAVASMKASCKLLFPDDKDDREDVTLEETVKCCFERLITGWTEELAKEFEKKIFKK